MSGNYSVTIRVKSTVFTSEIYHSKVPVNVGVFTTEAPYQHTANYVTTKVWQ